MPEAVPILLRLRPYLGRSNGYVAYVDRLLEQAGASTDQAGAAP